jgi:hypothetical protein
MDEFWENLVVTGPDGLVVTCALHDGIKHGAMGQSGAQREELGA